MPDKRAMLLTADKLSTGTHRGEVVVLLDLSSAGVFPEMEVGFRLLPAEARELARQLEKSAAEAETASPRD